MINLDKILKTGATIFVVLCVVFGVIISLTRCQSPQQKIAAKDLPLEEASPDLVETLACGQFFIGDNSALLCKALVEELAKTKTELRLQKRYQFCRKLYLILEGKQKLSQLSTPEALLAKSEFELCWSKLNPVK